MSAANLIGLKLNKHSFKRLCQFPLWIALLLLLMCFSFLIYSPGLFGDFAFDDYPNIIKNSFIPIRSLDFTSLKQAAFSADSGPLSRPISMMSFAINYYISGFDPFYFKLTNLLIHLCNGVLIFVLSNLIFFNCKKTSKLSISQTRWVSLAITTAWLVHPVNLTSVLYVVQRMNSLSSLFVLGGLISYILGRNRLSSNKSFGLLFISSTSLIFTLLAILSKENGALLPLFILSLELTVFSNSSLSTKNKRILYIFFFSAIAIPGLITLGYLASHPQFVTASYDIRNFTLIERLLTEPRILWFYIQMIVIPKVSSMGLFHDDILISHGWLEPITTTVAIVALLIVLIFAIALRKRQPIFSFGIFFFLVGHLLESSIIALEITFEHRNYLPMFGLIFIMFYYSLNPVLHKDSLKTRRLAVALMLCIFSFQTYMRASTWSTTGLQITDEVANHPKSPRANSEVGAWFGSIASKGGPDSSLYYISAMNYFDISENLDSHGVDGLFGLVYYSARLNKSIEDRWISELARRLEYEPPSASSPDKLMSIATCESDNLCVIPKEKVTFLIHSALKNPRLTSSSKALIYLTLSLHLLNTEKDISGGLRASYAAMESAPKAIEYHLNLIRLLIALGSYDKAKTQIAIAKSIDHFGIFSNEISDLTENIVTIETTLNGAHGLTNE